MKRISKIAIVLVAASALLFVSCARQPTTKRSTSLIKTHFKKYARKYPDTVYGKNAVKEVEVANQKEIHKNLVAVEAFITLGDGSIQRIHTTVEKGPLGWRFVSWENDTGM